MSKIVGLLNVMPAAVHQRTQRQWNEAFGERYDIELVQVCFDDDVRRKNSKYTQLLGSAVTASEAIKSGLDGLIVTGANLEKKPCGAALPFEDISYHTQLTELVDWADQDVKLTVYSCLASHIALHHMYGIERDVSPQKTFGVYEHTVNQSDLTDGLPDTIRAPHSRWGNVGTKLLKDAGIEVDIVSDEAGWLVAHACSGDRATVFVQGHPEYERYDLHAEYIRDKDCGLQLPVGYYPDSNHDESPQYSWRQHSQGLFTNLRRLL